MQTTNSLILGLSLAALALSGTVQARGDSDHA